MTPSAEAAYSTAALRAQIAPVLADRARAGVGLGVMALLVYAIADFIAYGEHVTPLLAIALGQIVWLGVAAVLLRGAPTFGRSVSTVLGTFVVLFASGLVSDALSANPLTTPLSAVGAAVATCALLPWGAGAQAVAAAIAAATCFGSVVFVRGTFVGVAQPAGLVLTLLIGSVYIAGAAERVRRQRACADAALAVSTHRAESEARIATVLAQAGEMLAAHLDEPDMLDRLHDLGCASLGVEWGATFVLDGQDGVLRLAAASGVTDGERAAVARLEMASASLAELTVGGVFEIPDVARNQDLAALVQGIRVASWVGAPMLCRGKLLGVQVHGRRAVTGPFSPEDRRMVGGLAHATALALENARRIADLEAASRLKTEFVATMSHELRTPLNVITGYTEMLAEDAMGELSEMQRETVARIRRSADELLELVNATLDVGRLEAGRIPVEREPVDVATLLAELEIEVRPLLAAGVMFAVHDGTSRLAVLVDRTKLKTIVKNLVGNACKFTRQGRVELEVSWHASTLVAVVRDTGIGIAPAHLPHIFEMFRQGDGSSTRRFGGVGLGLHIVRRLIDLLGGTIAVESMPGVGSTFELRVPAPLALRVAEGGRR